MKVLKKLSALLIALCMMLQVVAIAAPVPEDVIGTEYESAASLLCALELMVGDGTNFNPDANVTRAEFAQIMINIMGLREASDSMTPKGVFDDVAPTQWYAAPVEIGASIGAINGYGDGKFGPDDNVTGEQAVKLMIYATGWEVKAADLGGYPAGYISVAQEKDMLLGLNALDLTQPMTRGQVALLLVNSLKANMLQKVGTGTKVEYVEKDGVNLLSAKHNVYRYDGIVTQNDLTSLYSSISTLNEGYVEITADVTGEVGLFLAGDTTIGDEATLGKSVRAWYYYDEDKDINTVVSYDVLDSRNTVTTVDLDDIDYNTLSQTMVQYWPDVDAARASKVYIKSGIPAVLYNGVSVTLTDNFVNILNDAHAAGKTGTVTFIATGGDTDASVISITAYETYVVDRIIDSEYTIIDKLGVYKNGTKTNKSVVIDMEDSTVNAIITDTDDDEMEFEDLAEWDVLSVAMSPSTITPVVARVIVSNDTAEGVVDEINAKKDAISFVIDGEEYELSSSYINHLTNGASANAADYSALAINGVKVGYEGTFYLDAFGKIAAHEVTGTSDDASFGVITKYAVEDGASGKLILKVYADGDYMTYKAATKVRVDGDLVSESALETRLDTIAAADPLYSGKAIPVLFEVNENDEISYIDSAVLGADESEYSLRYLNKTDSSIGSMLSASYKKDNGSVNGRYTLSGSSPVITTPSTAADMDDAKNLSYKKASALSSTSDGKTYSMAIFTTDSSNKYKAEYAVVISAAGGSKVATDLTDGNTGTPLHDKQMHVVQGVSQVLDEEGEKTIKVYAITEGNSVELTFDANYYNGSNSAPAARLVNAVSTMYTAGGLTYPANASADRINNLLLEGDVIRIRQAEEDNTVIFIDFIWMMGENIFHCDDNGPLTAETRYRAIDIGFAKNYADSVLELQYLVNKTSDWNNQTTTQLFFDANNYPLVSENIYKAATDTTPAESLFVPDANGSYEKDVTLWPDAVEASCLPIAASSFKIMTYDADEKAGARVNKGSVSDLKLAIDGIAPSIVLIQYRANNPRGMYIINL